MGLYSLRSTLKTEATGATGGAGWTLAAARIKLGYTPLDDDDESLRSLATDGPLLQIRPGTLQGLNDLNLRMKKYVIKCDLYFAIDQNDDETFQKAETLLDDLTDKWGTAWDVSFDEPDIRDTEDPMWGRYEISVSIDP